jgi:hypothetical protein
MSKLQRNPDGSLTRLHPYAPTYILVMQDGRRIYHDVETSIRLRIAEERGSVAAFYMVNRGRTITLPIPS